MELNSPVLKFVSGNKSPRYHSRLKGCQIIDHTCYNVIGKKIFSIRAAYCKTHKVEICRCGYEWHWHFGTNSRFLENNIRRTKS